MGREKKKGSEESEKRKQREDGEKMKQNITMLIYKWG